MEMKIIDYDVILAAVILAIGFRWGMGRLADAIDAFRESWEMHNGLRDDEEAARRMDGS